MPTTHAPALTRARTGVVVAFMVNGVALASFLSRTPAVREELGLTVPQLGLLLLCLSGGSILGLPLAGLFVQWLRPARAVFVAALSVSLGLAVLSAGLVLDVVPLAGVGLVFAGLGIGTWDVAMNVEGAAVERALDRPLMPRLHGAFSIGSVLGAALGAGSAALGVPLPAQLLAVAVVIPLLVGPAVRFFLAEVPAEADEPTPARFSVLQAWKEPRTLLVGLMVLGFAFTEGSANDWIAITFVDGYGTDETLGAVAFGLFVSAMTVGRLFGGSVLERYGRVVTLRITAAFALAGLLLVILGGSTWLALGGTLLWGLGASLGFPVGMSAAADDPARAAVRVSVVSSVGYTAFLAGPPLIGLLAGQSGIRPALFVVLGALTLGLLTVSAARPLTGTTRTPAPPVAPPASGPR